MEKPEIQEMLEGMLNDEQTAEVLHRMSVSPEKLTEFRQHMALRGEMARDARGDGLTEEEDDRVWAAVLGATGGLVTGGTAVGSGVWSWLGRGAALLVTGLAGFFIGSAVNDGSSAAATDATTATSIEQGVDPQANARDLASNEFTGAAAVDRVDTVYLTEKVIEPQIVYREKVVYRDRPSRDLNDGSGENVGLAEAENSPNRNPDAVKSASTTPEKHEASSSDVAPPDFGAYIPAERYRSTSPFIPTGVLGAAPVTVTTSDAVRTSTLASDDSSPASDQVAEQSEYENPNDLIRDPLEERSPENRDQDLVDVPTLSLMQNRIEIGYAERLGRVAPAPVVQGKSEPAFDARSLEITYRDFNGRLGIGVRALYGAFSDITYERELNFDLGIVDTIYVESLGNSGEFNTQVFVNYRIPLGTERLALGLETSFGLSTKRFTLGGDASLIYLITDWIGAQAGIGLGSYWYTANRGEASLQENFNAGITPGLPDNVQGTMIEGRYGLFYRF